MPCYVGDGFVLGYAVDVQTVVPVTSAEDQFGVMRNGEHFG